MRREETTYKGLMQKYAEWSVEIPEILSDRIDLGSGLIPYDAEPDESRILSIQRFKLKGPGMTFPSEKIRELRTRDAKKHDWLLEHGAKLLKWERGPDPSRKHTTGRGGELEAYDAMARKYEKWKVERGGETWEFPDRKIKEEQDVDKRRYKIWSGYPHAQLINLRKA